MIKDLVNQENLKMSNAVSTAKGFIATHKNVIGGKPPVSLMLGGKTVQNGTPAPDNKVDIEGAGESGSLKAVSCGKNLFDESKSVNGFVKADLTKISASTYRISERYPIGEYIVSWGSTTAEYIYLIYYNESEEIIERTVFTMSEKNSVEVEQKSGAAYFAVMYMYSGENGTSFVYDLQIELGTTATDYEPYTATQADIPLNAPLYERDYIKYNMDGSGEESHKTYEMILDGSEAWSFQGTADDCRILSASVNSLNADKANRQALCTHFVKTYHAQSERVAGTFSFHPTINYSNFIYFAVPYSIIGNDADTQLSNWKAWLAENKPKVVCELAESTVTPLTEAQITAIENLLSQDGLCNVMSEGVVESAYFANNADGEVTQVLHDKTQSMFIELTASITISTILANDETVGGDLEIDIPDGYSILSLSGFRCREVSLEVLKVDVSRQTVGFIVRNDRGTNVSTINIIANVIAVKSTLL